MVGIYEVPDSTEEQIKALQELENCSSVSFSDRSECKEIREELESGKPLWSHRREYLNNMISKYGSELSKY